MHTYLAWTHASLARMHASLGDAHLFGSDARLFNWQRPFWLVYDSLAWLPIKFSLTQRKPLWPDTHLICLDARLFGTDARLFGGRTPLLSWTHASFAEYANFSLTQASLTWTHTLFAWTHASLARMHALCWRTLGFPAGPFRPGKSREGPGTERDRTGPRDLEGPVVLWSRD